MEAIYVLQPLKTLLNYNQVYLQRSEIQTSLLPRRLGCGYKPPLHVLLHSSCGDENGRRSGNFEVMHFSDTAMEEKGLGFWANCKRPKVNAFRQFPPGCGPSALREDLHAVTKSSASRFRFAGCANNSPITLLRSSEDSPKILEPFNSCLIEVDENGEVGRSLQSNVVRTDKSPIYQDQNHRNGTKSIETAPSKCNPKRAKNYFRNYDEEKGEDAGKENNPKRMKSCHRNRMYCEAAENGEILGSSNLGSKCSDFNLHREKVTQVLKMYDKLTSYLMVLRKEELQTRKQVGMTRIYIEAAMLLKKHGKWMNTSKQTGPIQGVEIGDKFLSRAELIVVGIHRQFHAGIDYMKKDGKVIATSIVASGKYFDDVGSSDRLMYSGHGGNPAVGKGEARDQRLERGNLALKNSLETKSLVRVIKGVQVLSASKSKFNFKYIYDGLYFVDDCRVERGNFGKLVFKFWLKRVSNQPKLTW